MHAQSESMETLAVHGGERRPGPEGSVVYPIYQGTVYSVDPGTGYHDIPYIRLSSTPSQRYLHDKLAALEGAQAAVATASGMAAVTTTLLSVLRAGDHLLASDCLYGGTPTSSPTTPGTSAGDAASSTYTAPRPGRRAHPADQGVPGRDDHQPADAGRAAARDRGLRPPGGPAHGDRQHVRDPGELPAAAGRQRGTDRPGAVPLITPCT